MIQSLLRNLEMPITSLEHNKNQRCLNELIKFLVAKKNKEKKIQYEAINKQQIKWILSIMGDEVSIIIHFMFIGHTNTHRWWHRHFFLLVALENTCSLLKWQIKLNERIFHVYCRYIYMIQCEMEITASTIGWITVYGQKRVS